MEVPFPDYLPSSVNAPADWEEVARGSKELPPFFPVLAGVF